ncbi:MAG TPA: hypothetical protein VKX16_00685 [Chloroflexota bacterium]|nr:hypothetical protein [Chloroflexota bacterium]
MLWSFGDDTELLVQNQRWSDLRAEVARRRLVREARSDTRIASLRRRIFDRTASSAGGEAPSVIPGRVIELDRIKLASGKAAGESCCLCPDERTSA